MKRIFSFSEGSALFVLRMIPSLLPGVEKAITIFNNPETSKFESAQIRKENDDYLIEKMSLPGDISLFDRFLSERTPYSWLSTEDLPFEVQYKEKVQLIIFNELNNCLLHVNVPNKSESGNDLFFIYFNKNLSNFGTIDPGKVLSTENKTIIGCMLRNSIITLIRNQQRDRDLSITLNESTKAILNERLALRSELDHTDRKYKDGIVRLARIYIQEIESENGVKYELSEAAINKIRDFSGDVADLKPLVTRAALFAETMNLDGSSEQIRIDDFHFITETKKQHLAVNPPAEAVTEVPVKYGKAFILLEKLENAAISLKIKNKLLTGANIGSEFPTPVSPPAITDALKKNRQKILYLFNEFPGRWGVIRSEFRPVQNILHSKPAGSLRSA